MHAHAHACTCACTSGFLQIAAVICIARSDEPPASEGSLLTAERLADEMSKVHRFGVQETWDWWQDWHLALWTENLDAVLVRLLRDGVPFVTRGTSAYVEIPRGITFQLQGLNIHFCSVQPRTRQHAGNGACVFEMCEACL